MSDEDNEEMQEDIDPTDGDEDYIPPKVTHQMVTRRGGAHPPPAPVEQPMEEDPLPIRRNLNTRTKCPYGCNKVLAQRTIDYHRTNGCRMGQEEPFADSNRKKNYCCGVCWAEFVTRVAFLTHLAEEHEVNASVHNLEFESRHMFSRFVRWLEAEGGAHFRHKSGAKKRASGKGIFMACNRSGYVGRSVSDPVKNKTGNFRTGYTCTGFIHGTEHPDGRITIEFCGDHYGHDARMRLPNIIKQLIAQKQMDGENCFDIINHLRRQFAPFAGECIYAQRVCLVDLDELRTLMVTSTRKWEQTGLPLECEIWEEEFLEKAGIKREGVPSVRKPGDKSTEELARDMNWPKPQVFIPKMKVNDSYVEIPELNKATAETRRNVALLQNNAKKATKAYRPRPPITVIDDANEDQEINVEDDPPSDNNDDDRLEEQDDSEISHPVPNSLLRQVLNKGKRDSTGKLISKQQCQNAMIDDLQEFIGLIKETACSVSGPYLVAFMTRIRQMKSSYANGLAPLNQPMSEQQSRILANGIHINSTRGSEKMNMREEPVQSEDMIRHIGTDADTHELTVGLVKKMKLSKYKTYVWD